LQFPQSNISVERRHPVKHFTDKVIPSLWADILFSAKRKAALLSPSEMISAADHKTTTEPPHSTEHVFTQIMYH
jgi:hypothetical protein